MSLPNKSLTGGERGDGNKEVPVVIFDGGHFRVVGDDRVVISKEEEIRGWKEENDWK